MTFFFSLCYISFFSWHSSKLKSEKVKRRSKSNFLSISPPSYFKSRENQWESSHHMLFSFRRFQFYFLPFFCFSFVHSFTFFIFLFILNPPISHNPHRPGALTFFSLNNINNNFCHVFFPALSLILLTMLSYYNEKKTFCFIYFFFCNHFEKDGNSILINSTANCA